MKLDEVHHTYSQDVDCCAEGVCNTLQVFTQDGGGGPYLVIKTERWAIDPTELGAFVKMLRSVLRPVQRAAEEEEERAID